MPFAFLKYLQPTHYFQLFMSSGHSVYPKAGALPKSVLDELQIDYGYSSDLARDYDVSWQAIQSGYLGHAETYHQFEKIPIRDNYHFIRKQFHPAWVFYVLMMRLFTFHNPISEIYAWLATRSITRRNGVLKPLAYKEWTAFKSELIAKQPLVSVIIPTLNRYDYLKDVLEDFEKQDYKHFEIIVVDQSEPFHPEFYEKFDLNFRIIHQEEKALWLARNTAIKEAQGSLIALSEDDVRIPINWISTHLKCLDFFNAEVSAGVFYPEGESVPQERSFFSLASQFATGNAMLYKSVFERVGLFDRQFEKQRMGDGEFGLRIYLAGIRSVSNPLASCVDVKADAGGLREMGSWDAFRPTSILSPRPIPSVVYYFRKYYGNRAARLALLRTIPFSVMPYQFKRNKVMMLLGVVISVFFLPVVLVQVFSSWELASRKLEEGDRIERIP